ncbi:MAG: hypothetical protein ACXWZM_02245 [Solirubrobacterales bacterium]
MRLSKGRLVKVAALALLALSAILGSAAGAGAAPAREAKHLHDARYCEIIEVKGTPPEVVVTVWNTIKLNNCPAQKWESFDAGELARELGDFLVILNGPRHFLMDSAAAVPGPVRSFHGLRMRKVATIPVSNLADLVQTPYSERIINRDNTWTWQRGRRVYELIAPCGARYLMQSYSQIRDPNLSIGQLKSLGDRLELPGGWRFQTRRLRHGLTLKARGKARIVQDELLNTYQREPARLFSPHPRRHRVDVSGKTRTVGSPSPGVLEDRGTISGDPFGTGTIDLVVTLDGPKASGPFRIETGSGTARGRFWMDYSISNGEIDFNGTACFASGTGAYRGIRGSGLKAHDHNTLDGQNGEISLKGFATY